MNGPERDAIKELHGDFLKNLHIDPEFLSPLIQNDVLTESMVDKIQAMPTQSEKIMQLLQILPRCGQKAFECFLEVLKKRSTWLAEELQEKYSKKQDEATETLEVSDDEHAAGEVKHDLEDEEGKEGNNDAPLPDQQHPISINLLKTISDASICSPNSSLKSVSAVHYQYRQQLNHLYINLKNKIRKHQKREMSFTTPEPATFKMIEKLHDQLLEKLTELQINVDQCYRAFGSNSDKVPLQTYIIKLKTSSAELEKKLKNSEEQRNKYCEQIIKLDLKVRNQASQIQLNEEKLRKITQNKTDQERECQQKVKELEEKLKVSEAKSNESEEGIHMWQMNYLRLQRENELLKRELYAFQFNHHNKTSAKEKLQGILQISHHNKVTQPGKTDDHMSISPRLSKNNDNKTSMASQQNRNDKFHKIHRTQSRQQVLSGLTYLSGSKIQNNKTETKLSHDQLTLSRSDENVSDIKQMKLSLQNNASNHSETLELSPKPFKLQVYIPTVSMQRNVKTEATDTETKSRSSHSKKTSNSQMSYERFKLQIPTVNMQRKDCRQVENDELCSVSTPPLSSQQFKLPSSTINIQRRGGKEQVVKDSSYRQGHKRQPLLKGISRREIQNESGTSAK